MEKINKLKNINGYKDIISVTCCCDENFSAITSVFLESLLEKSSQETFYDVILLADNIKQSSKNLIKFQAEKFQHSSLRILDIEDNLIKNINPIFGKAAYLRLLIPSILEDYKKIIYLDVDTIILKDLKEIFDKEFIVDNKEIYCYAVDNLNRYFLEHPIDNYKNYKTRGQYFREHVEMNENSIQKTFNSGVMILNLKKMREDKIVDKSILLSQQKEFFAADQHILYNVFNGEISYLERKWNVFGSISNLINTKIPQNIIEDWERQDSQPAIIHYADRPKPWDDSKIKFEEYFWYYARKTPFYEKLKDNIEKNKQIIIQQELKKLKKNSKLRYKIKRLIKNIFRNING
jgi:lipopolysaccharide biosynthesis glycosyltransferase